MVSNCAGTGTATMLSVRPSGMRTGTEGKSRCAGRQ